MHPTVDVVVGDDGSWVATAEFAPLPEHRGNVGWLHGGLAATVLDHVCARAGAASLGQRVVTGRLDVRYRAPVLLADGPYRVVATAAPARSRTVQVRGAIRGGDDRVLVEARTLFVGLEPPVG